MIRNSTIAVLLAGLSPFAAQAQQAPWAGNDAPISHHDRLYAAEQFSNTLSVTDPADNKLLGVIKLGDPQPVNFSPLYRGQVLVHGLGFSPDGKTLAVVSIGSNSVTWIDTATNAVRHTTYIGRSPHEAFFTPDGKEVWVTVRGEDYISVLDATTYEERTRLKTPGGPGMTIFSPDGKYGYVCSSFNPDLVVFNVASHGIVGHVAQPSPFCPNIAASPDGLQVWFTLKDTGKTVAFDARPPFTIRKVIDTGPITNHVNFVRTAKGVFAYVTVGGLNEVKVFRTSDFALVATVPVGKLPHGIWPSGDGSRVYVGLENDDKLAVIDAASNKVVGSVPIGQAPQAIAYVPNAVRHGDGAANLLPLGLAGNAFHLTLGAVGEDHESPTSISLFDQGLIQIVQGSVTGLLPSHPYVLALAAAQDGSGELEALSNFMTNPAGSAIANAVGPIRQVVEGGAGARRRYLVIAETANGTLGKVVQIQRP
ncbi:YncE family protein (plasmid) [Polymorphobacter sp. PAMC 29334]|uniref:YncE family protein n=1 Tax=Polymorphobacter sp. PAMC 29334 TaxID=2862331 RepID=UPI001C6771ED|nr:YncE family protein [Polymorphobacter sp. PAMC 29334]QYE33294.1 YncE family protein [Polymorphobacter sp. PAMC 29334]